MGSLSKVEKITAPIGIDAAMNDWQYAKEIIQMLQLPQKYVTAVSKNVTKAKRNAAEIAPAIFRALQSLLFIDFIF